ncbi:hypothetical protein, partial [Acinetobacter baumannii]|uniref:hypothetical protein n=1 Tax=Acinetobacter baumannii TaxID=470 RepID=UPI001D0E6FED
TSLHIFFAALLLFTLLLVITLAQSVIALNREYFPGRGMAVFLLSAPWQPGCGAAWGCARGYS